MTTRRLSCLLLTGRLSGAAAADLFLVTTSEGPGFASLQEVAEALEKDILPTFGRLMGLKVDNKIVAGGLPAGSRKLYLIVEAGSHDEIDRMLRAILAWGVFLWKVTPLQSLEGRVAIERRILGSLKAGQ